MARSLVVVALIVACAACNAIVGYGNLEKTPSGASSGGGGSSGGGDDDDDDTADGGGQSGSGDTGASSGSLEAGVTARCDKSKPFGTPVKVEDFDGAGDDLSINARLTTDELEAFWTGNSNSLHSAKRATRDSAWDGAGTILMNPKFLLLSSITMNGTKMYYVPDNGDFTVRSSIRAKGSMTWATGIKVTEPGTSDDVFYADSDDVVYLDAFKTGTSGERNLFSAALSGGVISSSFSPITITDQAGVTEAMPIVNSSETALYFLRGNDDATAKVFVSHRETKGAQWQTPVEEPALNGGDGDNPTWVSEDDCVIYLQRDLKTFMAKRPPQ